MSGLLAAPACQLPPGHLVDGAVDGPLDTAEPGDGAVADLPSVDGGYGGTDTDGGPDADGPATVAPDNLRVGDRVRPLNVEGPPLFSWLPHDAAGDQVQTAYQIQVRLESSGADVWDSGKVVSSDQAYVAYGGPALVAGESYTWTVRTWNRGDVASPWSASADFDTALADGAAGWGASWIRRAASGADAADEYTLARVERTLDAKPIRRARAYVSANHQFELHINGAVVDRGPAFAYPGEGYYQASDITTLLQAGHPVAIGVLYHWYGGGQGRPAGEPGLLARVVVDHDDGSREVIVSDEAWRVARASQWQTGAPQRNSDSGDFVEWIDMRQAADGWDMPGFDASGWAAPQIIGAHPAGVFSALSAQEPRLRFTAVAPASVTTLGDGAVVADFGVVIPARPVVRFASGAAGRVLNIQAGYHVGADGHVTSTPTTDLSFRFTQRDGAQEFRPMTYLGWRYLELSSPGETLAASAMSALIEHTDAPVEGAAQFDSSDATLNDVFALVQRSAIYGVQQQFVDPTREKGQFLGDTASTSYATMAAWMERDATQKAILELASSQARYWPDGRLNAVYPNGDGKRDIPDYTEMYPIWVWRYYLETGDRTLLGRVYAVMQNVADYVWSYRDGTTGLVTNLAGGGGAYQFGIVEWPPSERRGYDMATTARTTVNILGAEVQRVTGAAAAALGRPASEAATYATRSEQLTAAINSRLRRSDGIYIDGSSGDTASAHASQHANSYALAFGVVPADGRPAVADYVAGMGMSQGPMTAYWLAKALGDSERYDALLKLLTDDSQPGWVSILSQGGTYTWESWDAPARGDSESHAWAAQVAVEILEAMLGVRVIAPGAAVVGIRPPRGVLTFANGQLQTQRGPVKVSWMRAGSTGLSLTVDVPMNVRAEVALPAADVAATTATGAGAPRYRSTAGGWVIYDAGSGESVFTTR
ncbi:MAG TPA: alpha-L-rhamnosidase N-terminal domain-containing protein [Polyangia bacterium]